jgi:hypothetical protein
MESIHRNQAIQRLAYVDDTMMASQAGSKDVAKYLKQLRKSVGLSGAETNDTAAFLASNPKGL